MTTKIPALLLALLLAGCASRPLDPTGFSHLVVDGQEVVIARLSSDESIFVVKPRQACVRGTELGSIIHYTEVPRKMAIQAAWNFEYPAPASMPDYTTKFGLELCQWFNKNKKY